MRNEDRAFLLSLGRRMQESRQQAIVLMPCAEPAEAGLGQGAADWGRLWHPVPAQFRGFWGADTPPPSPAQRHLTGTPGGPAAITAWNSHPEASPSALRRLCCPIRVKAATSWCALGHPIVRLNRRSSNAAAGIFREGMARDHARHAETLQRLGRLFASLFMSW